MNPKHLDAIRRSFEIQAEGFENENVPFSKEAYLKDMLSCVAPNKEDHILEVAAGTGICGRSFSPLAQTVICLDAVPAMLQIGKQEAERCHLNNMVFVKGCAEELPFLENSFDIVFSRLAFHHFANVKIAFSEMKRVLKPGGKLVMVDMEAAAEELRTAEDEIETMRDPSHVKNMSKEEMTALFTENHLSIKKCETARIRQNLKSWLTLTKTPERVQAEITKRMKEEMSGGEKTGFSPFMENGEICFDQKWILIVGKTA